jgi:argininosuccinate synthase
MPAAWLLLRSLRHLEGASLTQDHLREKQRVEQIWVEEAVEGRWFSDLRSASQSFVDASAAQVSGSVTWQLDHRSADTISIVAANPLYLRDRDGWEIEAVRSERSAYAASAPSGTSVAPAFG